MGKGYLLGAPLNEWSPSALNATFVVTEDCNLRCKYCYITHKASNKRLDFETAKKYVDYLLSGELNTPPDIILDFIGGEPLLEIDLIDQICDYFKVEAYKKNHSWYWNYRFNFTTNGVIFSDERVQRFLEKNKGKCSVCITIDGTKEKHDMHRVFPDGSGSYDVIVKNIPQYVEQLGGRTKATYASADLKYLKDSIVSLWNMGIKYIASNVVLEDVWQDGDDDVLEQQLIELADYALENKLYNDCLCTFFYDEIDGYSNSADMERTVCGAGKMIALGPNGSLYPCIRYKDYSLNNKGEWVIGTVDEGIDMEKVRPFMMASRKLQEDEECLNCEIAAGCMYCQGLSYDEADTATNFSRVKYSCKMHKARVRANDYYFSKLYNMYGVERVSGNHERKRLYFILNDDFITFCQSENTSRAKRIMNKDVIIEGLKYARNTFCTPIFIHSNNEFNFEDCAEYDAYRIHHIVPAKFYKEAAILKDYELVFSESDIDIPVYGLKSCQVNIDGSNIERLFEIVKRMFEKSNYVNINIVNVEKAFNGKEYEAQLHMLADYMVASYINDGKDLSINLFEVVRKQYMDGTKEHRGCKAGDRSLAISPSGEIYVCPAYYLYDENSGIGDIWNGISRLKNGHLYKQDYQPICQKCDAYQCINCVYLNEKTTNEVNVSPSFQCRKGQIERSAAVYYLKKCFPDFEYVGNEENDPIIAIIGDTKNTDKIGYYTLY